MLTVGGATLFPPAWDVIAPEMHRVLGTSRHDVAPAQSAFCLHHSPKLNGPSTSWDSFIASIGGWKADIFRNATNLKFSSPHLCLDAGGSSWLTSSCGLNALIFHAVQGPLCNLQAQQFSGQYLNYVPAGRSLIQAGSSRHRVKK